MPRLLVVTAVAAEADAVLARFDPAPGVVAGLAVHRALTPAGLVDAVAGGVGPVAAAVSTAAVLAEQPYDLVLSVGIGGGFGRYLLAVADRSVFADLGAEQADGNFSSVAELGFGDCQISTDEPLLRAVAERTGSTVGAVLTVATVTGTAARADRLRLAHPGVVAEGMEGYGVGSAAGRHGVRFGELRAISNQVGPRDRSSWRIAEALQTLGQASTALFDGGPL